MITNFQSTEMPRTFEPEGSRHAAGVKAVGRRVMVALALGVAAWVVEEACKGEGKRDSTGGFRFPRFKCPEFRAFENSNVIESRNLQEETIVGNR
jgi:hypothetical protein